MAASSPSRLCFTFLLLFQVTLKLIETFVDKSEDLNLVATHMVPLMMEPILRDYTRNVPDARYA